MEASSGSGGRGRGGWGWAPASPASPTLALLSPRAPHAEPDCLVPRVQWRATREQIAEIAPDWTAFG